MSSRPLDWLRAARPLALGNIWPPLLAGWFLAVEGGAPGGVALLALLLVAGWLDQLAIVFLNDLADRETDGLNTRPTLFSGGSRVLVEARITPPALRRAGLLAGTGFLALAMLAGVLRLDPRIPLLALAGLLLLQAYSFSPLRLNYQGGGELLQGLGCGLVLPLLGLLLAGGDPGLVEPGQWLGMFFLAMPGALGSTLTDAPADRLAGKETLAARFGSTAVSLLAIGFAAMGLVMLEALMPVVMLYGLACLTALTLGVRLLHRLLRVEGGPREHHWNMAAALLLLGITMLGWLALVPLPA